MNEFKKYPKIKKIGDKENKELLLNDSDNLVIEEKLDGANFRFMIKDEQIIFGSRTRELTEEQDKQFDVIINYLKDKLKDKHLKVFEGYIFYGEGMIKHSLNYNWEAIPRFVGFDVYDIGLNRFIDYKKAKEIYETLGITFVPIVKETTVKEFKNVKLNDDVVPISKYAPTSNPKQQAEGIVIKNYNKQIFAKFVRTKFKEINKEAFGKNKKYAENDDERVVAMYCTNPRIDKQIFKLINDGYKLKMKLMEYLPKMVWNDIIEENGYEILKSNYVLNLRNVRKLITKRCLTVLKNTIINNSLK